MTTRNNILLVDDEKEFADALAKRLVRRGYTVQTAYSVEQALKLANNALFNAAILDVTLPDGNGHDLFNDLISVHPEIRAVMLTGYGDIQKAFQLGKKGLYAYFSKPCDFNELVNALSEALKEE